MVFISFITIKLNFHDQTLISLKIKLTTCPIFSELEPTNAILLWVQMYAMSRSSSEVAWHLNSKSCLITVRI